MNFWVVLSTFTVDTTDATRNPPNKDTMITYDKLVLDVNKSKKTRGCTSNCVNS